MIGKYKIITLCGSTKFKDQFIEKQKKQRLYSYYVINSRPVNDNRAIVLDFVQNQDKEYTDEQKVKIVTAYQNMLEQNGEDYVDNLIKALYLVY